MRWPSAQAELRVELVFQATVSLSRSYQLSHSNIAIGPGILNRVLPSVVLVLTLVLTPATVLCNSRCEIESKDLYTR
jgi:hypothetical protein